MPESQERELSSRETVTQELIASSGPVQTIRQITDQMIAVKEADLQHKPPTRPDGHSWVIRVNPNGVRCERCGQIIGQPKGMPMPPTPDWGCAGRRGA